MYLSFFAAGCVGGIIDAVGVSPYEVLIPNGAEKVQYSGVAVLLIC